MLNGKQYVVLAIGGGSEVICSLQSSVSSRQSRDDFSLNLTHLIDASLRQRKENRSHT